ncbi:F0F1 ATP synthase subunit A [Candidatus Nomurabacteria bacterium]|nr:F0F1 ATP synthase subunit A [Candidatus Kaiserbacteria bacterium]MCB9813942.1 F0F1 ATP synthase subunit A [Candidatus Nomurabacteria bacterium]
MMNISLQPEYVLSLFGFLLTNTFLTSIIVTLVLGLASWSFYLRRNENENRSIFLKCWFVVVYEALTITDSITHNRNLSKKVLPLIATLFLFIVTSNMIALVPGFLGSFFVMIEGREVSLLRSPNSDLTTTLALALVTVTFIQYFSISSLGFGKYLKRFINFSGPVNFVLGFFEVLSESVRVLSFSFRLFGNVFAGEVLLLVIAFLIPYIIPIPFMILEVFIGSIQALIFSMLALTYIKSSTGKHSY